MLIKGFVVDFFFFFLFIALSNILCYSTELIVVTIYVLIPQLTSSTIYRNALFQESGQINPCDKLPNETLTENPKGCKYFFYCRNGYGIEGFCPNHMWFNVDAGICDQPKNVPCHFDDPKPNENNTNGIMESIKCPITDSRSITFLPSKVDCGRYYICYHGKPIKQQCNENLHWNALENKCDQPAIVQCRVSKKEIS